MALTPMEQIEQENTRAALAEGPVVYALLQMARASWDGVGEADLGEMIRTGRARREALGIVPNPEPEAEAVREPDAAERARRRLVEARS